MLAARPGKVHTRDQLLAEVWGWRDGSGARTVDSHPPRPSRPDLSARDDLRAPPLAGRRVGVCCCRSLPGRPAGLGVAVAGLAVVGIALACTRPRDPWRLACWAAAAALAVIPALRLLAVFVPLFITADAAFAQLVDDAFDLDFDLTADRLAVFALVAGLAVSLVLTGASRARPGRPVRLLGRTEWLIALAALDALFAAFVALQLTTLFGGDRHVLQTAGLTYAEYAHQGFGQLMAAAALTLAVIALARRDSPVLTLLLGLLCALTLVVLASALKRLEIYEEAFGFALTFALANPDARIAEHNIKRFEHTGEMDRAYLRHLSADAAPALIRGGEGHKTEPEPDGILSANLGRARARAAIGSAR